MDKVKVKLSPQQLATLNWKRSSRGGTNDNDVEVAFLSDGGVAIRDSDDLNVALIFTAAEWDAFVGGARDGEFNL